MRVVMAACMSGATGWPQAPKRTVASAPATAVVPPAAIALFGTLSLPLLAGPRTPGKGRAIPRRGPAVLPPNRYIL